MADTNTQSTTKTTKRSTNTRGRATVAKKRSNGAANGNGRAGNGKAIQVHARRVSHSAGALATQAKAKAQDLTARSKTFVSEHPAEAAGLAVAGLTVLGALLGRRRLGPVVKGLASTAVVAKLGEVLAKRVK